MTLVWPDLSAPPLSIGLAYALLAMTPGANFLLVTQLSLTAPRHHAVMSALGIASGASVVALAALAGAPLLFSDTKWLWLFDLAFAALLTRLGISTLRKTWSAVQHGTIPPSPSALKCLRLGLVTAMLNPMTLAFFIGLSVAPSLRDMTGMSLAATLTIFSIALIWFGAVACLFSNDAIRLAYNRVRPWADTGLSLLFLATALRIASGALGSG